jgi:hypothetical protein
VSEEKHSAPDGRDDRDELEVDPDEPMRELHAEDPDALVPQDEPIKDQGDALTSGD